MKAAGYAASCLWFSWLRKRGEGDGVLRVWKIGDEIFLLSLKLFILCFLNRFVSKLSFLCQWINVVSSSCWTKMNEQDRYKAILEDRAIILSIKLALSTLQLTSKSPVWKSHRREGGTFPFSSPLTALDSDLHISRIESIEVGIVQSWTDKQRIVWEENLDETPSSRIAKIAATIKDTMLASSLIPLYTRYTRIKDREILLPHPFEWRKVRAMAHSGWRYCRHSESRMDKHKFSSQQYDRDQLRALSAGSAPWKNRFEEVFRCSKNDNRIRLLNGNKNENVRLSECCLTKYPFFCWKGIIRAKRRRKLDSFRSFTLHWSFFLLHEMEILRY